MLRLLTLIAVLSLTGCAAMTGWLQSDAGGDPDTGPTQGEVLADGLAPVTPVAGPFAGIALAAVTALSAYSNRKKKPE